ncbi:MAG: hypothetical protein E4G90_05825, partial [Gemmatimonadales bacterium]
MTTSLPLLFVLTMAVPTSQDTITLREAILAAEDARPAAAQGLAPLLRGIESTDPITQRLAVRALGRLERPDLSGTIAGLLSHLSPSVRAEAVNALGQSIVRGQLDQWRQRLGERGALEDDPTVQGVLFRTLGRLPLGEQDDTTQVEQSLVSGTYGTGGRALPEVLTGATHGLYNLYRRTASRRQPSGQAVERLVELTTLEYPALVRRQALAALTASGRVDSGAFFSVLSDPDWQVRRIAVTATVTRTEAAIRDRIVGGALHDPHPAVRLEALRASGRTQLGRDGCGWILEATQDRVPSVALQAIDLLSRCGRDAESELRRMARRPFKDDDWHAPAHALVSLAGVSPLIADSVLSDFAGSLVWHARLYAARTAAATGNLAMLERLASDPNPNVREAALTGLRRHIGHRADSLFVDALRATDYQLVMTAARVLDSTPDATIVVPALLAALERITGEARETSRDPRVAILNTLGTLAGPDQASSLRVYLSDFDFVVAQRAAELITRWTGVATTPNPRPLPRMELPTWSELSRIKDERVILEMQDGGRLVIALHPFESPTNT